MKNKREAIVLIIIALTIICIYFAVDIFVKSPASAVEITVDGQYYGTYSLSTTNEIHIDTDRGSNTVSVYEGYCRMDNADCPDKLCVKQGKINKTNETITCLPNRVVIRAIGGDGDIDVMVK